MKNIVPHLLTLLQTIEQAIPGNATARIEARDHNLYINVHTSLRMSRRNSHLYEMRPRNAKWVESSNGHADLSMQELSSEKAIITQS